MLGLQNFAILFSHWPHMAEAYDRFYAILHEWAGEKSPKFEALRRKFEARHLFITHETFLAGDSWRAQRVIPYEDMHDQCHFGLTGTYPERSLDDMADPSAIASQLTASMASYLRQAQNRMIMAEALQEKINALLNRPAPKARQSIYDIGVYVRLLDTLNDLMPVFADELGDIFGIKLTLTAVEIAVTSTYVVQETTQSPEIPMA
jgi:hypothetical protein